MKALSIRQPWAWLIVNGHKDIENRSWKTNFRGRVAVHAAKAINRSVYEEAKKLFPDLPDISDLQRGGIVGTVEITDCVTESSSPWFHGKNGFVLGNPAPCAFIPMKGRLGFFNVEGGMS